MARRSEVLCSATAGAARDAVESPMVTKMSKDNSLNADSSGNRWASIKAWVYSFSVCLGGISKLPKDPEQVAR